MTQIAYKSYGKGQTEHIRISIHGHAGYNVGNDIVCSAISCLTCTLMAVLQDCSQDGSIESLAMEAVDGSMTADFIAVDTTKWKIIWSVIDQGYSLLEESYPDYVKRI